MGHSWSLTMGQSVDTCLCFFSFLFSCFFPFSCLFLSFLFVLLFKVLPSLGWVVGMGLGLLTVTLNLIKILYSFSHAGDIQDIVECRLYQYWHLSFIV